MLPYPRDPRETRDIHVPNKGDTPQTEVGRCFEEVNYTSKTEPYKESKQRRSYNLQITRKGYLNRGELENDDDLQTTAEEKVTIGDVRRDGDQQSSVEADVVGAPFRWSDMTDG